MAAVIYRLFPLVGQIKDDVAAEDRAKTVKVNIIDIFFHLLNAHFKGAKIKF